MGTAKKYTKFLNDGYRHRYLLQNRKLIERKDLGIPQYARYVCDSQIFNRSKEYENDKNACYGFSPINFLCAIHENGEISKKLFEFNIVNHFLKEKEGDKAVEVVEAMLVDLVCDFPTIKTFDIDKIDAELKRIESEYLKQQALEKPEEKKETGENNNEH